MALTLMLLLPLLAAIALIAIPGESTVERGIALGSTVVDSGARRRRRPGPARGRRAVDPLARRPVALRRRRHLGARSSCSPRCSPSPSSRTRSPARSRRAAPGSTFLGCILLVEAGALGDVHARDAILFFIAFEVVLVPMWVLVAPLRRRPRADEARADAAGRFVLFTVLGSTLMLIGILFLVHQQGTSDLTVLAGPPRRRPLPAARRWPSPRSSLARARRSRCRSGRCTPGCPSAHTIAPTAGSVLLAAVLLKMGTYGIVRLAVATVPDGVAVAQPRARDPRRRRHPLGRPGLPRRARPQAPHRLQLGGAHGLRRARHRLRQRDRPAGGALRQHRARRRRGPALLRRRRPQGAVGHRPTSTSPGRPCATRLPASGSPSSSGSPRRSGCRASSASGVSSSRCMPRGRPPPAVPSRSCASASCSAPSGLALAAAYALRVARIVWAGEGSDAAQGLPPSPSPTPVAPVGGRHDARRRHRRARRAAAPAAGPVRRRDRRSARGTGATP